MFECTEAASTALGYKLMQYITWSRDTHTHNKSQLWPTASGLLRPVEMDMIL